MAENTELLTHKMLNAIREYWEVMGDEDTIKLILNAAKSGMGYQDVVARRQAAVKSPVKRKRATREPITFCGGKGLFKSFEEDGRIELVLRGLPPEVCQDLQEKILALFPSLPSPYLP